MSAYGIASYYNGIQPLLVHYAGDFLVRMANVCQLIVLPEEDFMRFCLYCGSCLFIVGGQIPWPPIYNLGIIPFVPEVAEGGKNL